MIFVTMSSPPTKSAPASVASRTLSPLAMTSTRTDLPRPCGRTTVPRTTWSECLGSTPKLIASSTVSLNFVWCVFLISSAASASLYGRASTFLRAFSTCLPACFMPLPLYPERRDAVRRVDLVAPELLGFHDFQAHVARRTHHRAHSRVQIGGVEVDKLDLGDFLHLLLGYLADFVAVGLRGAFHDSRGARQKNRSRRRFQNKSKRAVGINRHQHRKNHSVGFFRGLGVELLAKIHNVQAMWAERRTDRRRRRSLASRKLQLNRRLNLLCHVLCLKVLRANSVLSELFNARKIQFHRSRSPENRHRNLQPAVISVNLFHRAVKISERAVHNPYLLVTLKHDLGLRSVRRRMHAVDDRVHFRLRKG